jgi:hypothetical protein
MDQNLRFKDLKNNHSILRSFDVLGADGHAVDQWAKGLTPRRGRTRAKRRTKPVVRQWRVHRVNAAGH